MLFHCNNTDVILIESDHTYKLRFEGGSAPLRYKGKPSPYAPWARERLSIADCDSWFGLNTEARKSRTKSRTHKKLGYRDTVDGRTRLA